MTTDPFTITRVFDAPRSLVWQVFTEPQHLAHWVGGEGFRSIHGVMDLRPGGTYHYGLEGPNGMQMWGKQVYREIVPGEKLVLVQSFSDKDGGLARHPMAPTWPLQMLATTTLEDAEGGKTRVTVTWLPHESDDAGLATFDAARAGMAQGFGGTFRKLDSYLATLPR